MTDQEFGVMLRDALLDAARLDGARAEAEHGDSVPSGAFPSAGQLAAAAEAQAGRDHRRKLCRQFWQSAACLALASALVLGGAVALNPSARAWVTRFFTEHYDDHTAFQFDGAQGGVVCDGTIWRPTWLPDGFAEAPPSPQDHPLPPEMAEYVHADGRRIYFDYMSGGTVGTYAVDNEHSTESIITLAGGWVAHLLTTISPEYPSFLIWMDEDKNAAFLLHGYVEPDELIRIAESIEAQ